jgi:hypothetical protein
MRVKVGVILRLSFLSLLRPASAVKIENPKQKMVLEIFCGKPK